MGLKPPRRHVSLNEELRLNYEYEIEEAVFVGTRIAFGSGRPNARRVHDTYPRGLSVDVYYDPEQHNRCVLKPGGNWSTLGEILCAGLATSVGLAMVLSWLIGWSRERHTQRRKHR